MRAIKNFYKCAIIQRVCVIFISLIRNFEQMQFPPIEPKRGNLKNQQSSNECHKQMVTVM